MPYSNIVFVKLFLSLFEEDDRFLYQLNESQQLLYIKMLYLAGSTNNHIPKNIKFICNKVNYHHEEACFLSDIERIKNLFQGFKEYKDEFYYFNNFSELHNFIGKSKGNPKEIQRIVPEKSKRRVREEKEKRTLTSTDFLTSLKVNASYSHIDIDTELGKMDAWLLAHKGRQKTKRFIVNWLNKIERPLLIGKSKPPQPFYKAPDEKERFKFNPECKTLLKTLAEKKGI